MNADPRTSPVPGPVPVPSPGQGMLRRAFARAGRLLFRGLILPRRALARRGFRLERLRRVLVVDLGGIGNVVLSTPILAALRHGLPEARIDVLVSSAAAGELLLASGLADRAPVVAVRVPEHLPEVQDIRAAAAGAEYGLLVVGPAHGVQFYQGLAADLGIPYAVGEDVGLAGYGYTHPVAFRPEQHESERSLSIARSLGIEPHPASTGAPPYPIRLPPEQARRAETLLEEAGLGGRAFIGVQAGANENVIRKRWPADRFGRLLRALRERGHGPFLLLGGEDEGDLANEVRNAAGADGVHDLTGRTDILEAMGILAKARMALTNDSGLMHLSVAVGTPVVAIFGPTSVAKNRPLGPFDEVVRLPLPCSPCYPSPTCGFQYQCLDWIVVQQVLDACERVLARVKPG